MNTKLYVGNLSPITTAEDLHMLFNQTGRVVSVDLVKDKNTGRPKGFMAKQRRKEWRPR
jgi:RNA recognition motif-containing protein